MQSNGRRNGRSRRGQKKTNRGWFKRGADQRRDTFKKGHDPRRHALTPEERRRGGFTASRKHFWQWSAQQFHYDPPTLYENQADEIPW